MDFIDDMIGMGREISLRTSKVETRDEIVTTVPISKLVEDIVVNWSHNDHPTRFHMDVGVAHGSELSLVRSLLL